MNATDPLTPAGIRARRQALRHEGVQLVAAELQPIHKALAFTGGAIGGLLAATAYFLGCSAARSFRTLVRRPR